MKKQINLGEIGVVIIDMQQSFLDDHDPVTIEYKIGHQQKVLDFCFRQDYSVAVLEYEDSGNTIRDLTRYINRFERNKYFFKSCNDGFNNKFFLKQLENWGLDSLILMGVNTSRCVRETGMSALKNGFEIITSGDLINNTGEIEEDSFCNEWAKEKSTYYFESSDDLLRMLRKNNLKNSFF